MSHNFSVIWFKTIQACMKSDKFTYSHSRNVTLKRDLEFQNVDLSQKIIYYIKKYYIFLFSNRKSTSLAATLSNCMAKARVNGL